MKTASLVESSPSALRWVSLLFLVAAVSAVGCSKKSNEPPAGGTEQGQPVPIAGEAAKPETQPETSPPGGSAPAPAAEQSPAEHGEAAPPIVPGATPAEIWTQIQKEQGELAEVIQKTELEAVHHHAFAIRDLVTAAAGKTQGLGASDAAKVQKIVKDVGTLAEKLDKAGDSGDLTATKQHYASLQQELQVLSPLLGAH